MARTLASKPNVIAPGGSYPYGRIKDTPSGTPVNEQVYGDFHQFFAKLLDAAGIVANGLPDNSADGFEYFNALLAVIDAAVVNLLDLKGDIDASSNPDYPAGAVGDSYFITVAGKVGGASGKIVAVGDLVVCKANNDGGSEAAVGTSWFVMETNLTYVPVNKAGDSMTGSLAMGGNKVTGLAASSSNGEAVRHEQLTALTPGAWQNLTLDAGNGYINGSRVPQYRIDGFGQVHLRGIISIGGSPPAGDHTVSGAAALPVPSQRQDFMHWNDALAAAAACYVNTSGTLRADTSVSWGGSVILDGLSYWP